MKPQARFLSELEQLVERIVCESGNMDGFNPRGWLKSWLARPTPALGGKRPNEFLRTDAGRIEVRLLIERMQSGAYS